MVARLQSSEGTIIGISYAARAARLVGIPLRSPGAERTVESHLVVYELSVSDGSRINLS